MKHLSTMKHINPMKYINTMKHIFTMKYRKIAIRAVMLLLALLGTMSSNARVFERGERIYFHARPASTDWWANGTYENTTELWALLKDGGSDYWLLASWESSKSNLCYIEIPDGAARNWNTITLARTEKGNRYNIYNSTGDINLNASWDDCYRNYIEDFKENDSYCQWRIVALAPNGNPAEWGASDYQQICTSAAGSDYILAPRDYDYSSNTGCHAWFKYNSGTNSWECIQGPDMRETEGDRDCSVALGAAGSDTYYFLQTGKPSACRLVRVHLNQDCSEGAAGACKITNFAAVASDANVTDETCAVDGLVAFDDKHNAGDLMIWCIGVDTVTVVNSEITVPQQFKLEGFDASSTRNYTLHAKFLSGTEACNADYVVTVSPPSTTPTTHTTTGTAADLRLVRFTEEDVELTPDRTDATYFLWTNTDNEEEVTTGSPIHTFDAPTEEKTINYVYLATNMPPVTEPNLISEGGSFNSDGGFSSDYEYWGTDLVNFYSGANKGKSGGYAISANSKTFASSYNEVTPHEGSHFGLFDSKSNDGSEDQAAWQVSSATISTLKVQEGESYLFSFWVANINNYGEMNNGAQLQFQISYDGGAHFSALGGLLPINLSDYRDNRWHGVSAIETASSTSSNVVLRVINLNKSTQNRGNDFGLDDIRFEAITSHTANIAAYEIFPVTYLKCVIEDATFAQQQPDACGATSATVDYTVNFKNPRGDLYIYEGTTLLAKIDHDDLTAATYHTGTLTRPLDGATHTLTVYFEDANDFRTDAPETYSYTAHTTPVISVTSTSWNAPDCDVKTATLTAVISYTNQNGTLTANVDGGTAITPSYIVENDTAKTITLEIPGVIADGKTGHKLNVSFSGSHGCSISNYAITTAAPYGPQITSTTYAIQDYQCGDENYKVKITVNFSNGQGKDLTITDGTHTKVLTPAADATSANWTFDMPWEDPVTSHTFKAYFAGKESCKDLAAHKATYTAPIKPYLNVEKAEIIDPTCNSDKYKIDLKYTYRVFKGTTITYKIGSTTIGTETVSGGTDPVTITKTLTSDALACDGGSHTFSFSTGNAKDCEFSKTFTAPLGNMISSFAVAPIDPVCEDETYKLRASWTVTAAGAYDKLIIARKNGAVLTTLETLTLNSTNATSSVDLSDEYAIDATHPTLVAYLEQRGSTCLTTAADYATPVVPAMEIGTCTFEAIGCNKSTYDLVVPVTYTNQHGKMWAWIDDDTAHKIEITASSNCKTGGDYKGYLADAATRTTYIVFSSISLTGDHKVSVDCDGVGSCHLTKALDKAKDFTAPPLPKASIEPVTMPDDVAACDQPTFTLAIDLTFTYQDGDLQVWVDDDKKGLTTITASTIDATDKYIKLNKSSQTKTITLAGLPSDGGSTHKLYYAFNKAGFCNNSASPYALPTFPRSPTITNVVVSDVPAKVADCLVPSYDATVTVSYLYPAGEQLMIDYTDKNDVLRHYGPITLTGSPQAIFLDDVLNDIGKGSKSLEAYFQKSPVDFTGCHHSANYTAPSNSSIVSGFAVAIDNRSICGSRRYNLSGTITFSDDASDDLIISFPGVRDTTIAQANCDKSGTPFTMTGLTAEAIGKTLIAKFKDQPDCTATSETFSAPDIPGFDVDNMSFTTPSCDEITTTLKFDLKYTYQSGAKLNVWVDSGTKIPVDFEADKNNELTITNIEIPNVSADGVAHTLHVEFVGGRCPADEFTTLAAPFSGKVTSIQDPIVSDETCNSDTYTVIVKFEVSDNSIGKSVTATCKGKSDTKTAKSGTNTLTITDVPRTLTVDDDDVVYISFPTAVKSCSYTKEYTENPKPRLVSITITDQESEVACDAATYTLKGTISYTNIDADPYIWLDSDEAHAVKVTGTPTIDGDVATLSFSTGVTVPTDGATHTLHLKAGGSTAACPISKIFTSIWRPLISSVSVGDPSKAYIYCDETYSVDVTVNFTQGKGQKLYVEYTDQSVTKTANVTPAADKTSAVVTLTGLKDADHTSHTVKAYFDGFKECTPAHTATYTSSTLIAMTDDFTAVAQPMKCNDVAYTVKGKIYANVDGGNITITSTDGKSATVVASTSGTDYTVSGITLTGTDHKLTAAFDGHPTCATVSSESFDEPLKPELLSITIADQESEVACDAATYTLKGTINYTKNINADSYIWLDSDEASAVKVSGTPTIDGDVATLSFSTGVTVPTDGATHTLHLKAGGSTAACPISKTFTSIWRPQIESVTANQPTTFAHCNGSYGVSGFVTFSNGNAQPIIIEYTDKDGNPQTKEYSTAIDATTIPYNITGLDHIGGHQDVIKAYFKGTTICDATKQTAPYTTPTEIVINSFTANVQPKGCNHTQYTIKGELTTNAATSATLTIKDENNNATTATLKAGSTTTYEYTLNSVVVNGTNKHLTALFEGINCYSKDSELFDEPAMPTAKVEIVTPKQPDCDVTTYELDFEISYEYQPQPGKVTVWVDNDHKAEKEFDIEVGQSTSLIETLSGADLIADGSPSHVLYFQFAGNNACGGSQEGTFTAPRTPLITNIDVERPDRILCTDDTYPATVKVTTENADGEKVIVKYTYENNVKTTDAVAVPAEEYVEIPVTFDKKDGVSHETIYVYFEGADFAECQETEGHKKVFSTPSSSAINDFVAEIHDLTTCDNLLYSLSGTITYGGSASGDMIISFDDIHTKDTIIPMANCDPAGTPFTLSGLTQPVSSYAISAHFDGETCTSHSQEFNSPVVPMVEIANANYSAPACNETTTNLTFDVIYTKQDGALHVSVDGNEKIYTIKSGETPSLSDDAQTVTLVISDLLADESKRSLQVWFDGERSCGESFNKTFTYPIVPQAPFSPKILTKQAKMNDVACDDDTYTLDVTFTVENSQNKPATLSLRGTGAAVTANTTDGITYTYTFTDVTRTFDDKDDDFVVVSFAESDADCSLTPMQIPFTETAKPVASVVSVEAVQPHCDSATFVLNFELSYTYQHGDVTVWVDDNQKAKQRFTIDPTNFDQDDPLPFVGQLSGTDLVADGSEDHVLHFLFDGEHACSGESDLFDFPNTPLIDTIIITGVPVLVPDENDPYQPTIKVAYERAKGQKIILEYFDKGDVAHRDTSNILTADKDTCIFTGIDFNDVAVAGERHVNAYFEGAAFDDCHEGGSHTAIYRAPSNSSIEFITSELINTSTCNTLRYNLKGTVQFVGSAVGDLIVELEGTTFMTRIFEADCTPNTPLSFEIKNVTAAIPTEGKQLKAYFSGIPGNPAYSTEVHHQPVIPTVKVENPTYSTPQCNESVTSLTFDLKYIKQQGNLRLFLDNKEYAYTIQTGAPLSHDDDTEQTATIVIEDLPADLSVRDLWVWFDGATDCKPNFTMPQAPYSPKVTSHKAEITNIACDKDTYTLNVSFTVENSLGKDATFVFRGESVNVSTTDGTNYSHSFNNVARTYGDVTDDVVELSFAGNDADCSGALYSIAYTETPKPAISLTLAADQGTTTCGDETYPLQGEIRYTYLDQTPEIWLDEEAHRAIPVQTMQADEQVIDLADLGINVPADGREHHVYIKPNGWTDACAIDVPFNALQQPVITAAEVSGVPAFISCGETYSATVTVDYVHAFGKTITVACTDNGSIQTYTSAAITDNDGQTVITLPSLSDHDGVTALSIYVDDETCAYTSASITQPKLNTIEPDFAVNVSATPCGVVDYAVWGTIKFNNAADLGELIVKTEDGVQADVTIKTATSAEFRIEHYTVAGTAMQLTAYFENAATYSVLSAPFDSPDVPDLTLDDTAVDTVFTCGDKSYTVRVAFTATNQSGTGYVLDSIANGAVRTVETISVSATAAQFVIARPAKAEQHFVVVRYPATGCEVISQALDINPYTKPKPLISLTAIDRLCNNETELILPLVITQGDIDEATLTLTNSKGEKVITAADMSINVAHDTLSYNLPAQLAAGKYTATVDARDTLDCETSASQSIEFALDGVVFSKWTDVLLVDNEGGLFTGYQWYENDKLLEGKTDQVLYLPEGMSGKSYYCVLQTAEGAIYTCVSDFGDLPRSADNPKTQSANHITVLPNRVATNGAVTVHQSLDENLHLILMSATGKRVAEYTQQEATKLIDMPGVQGIYLLRIESDSDVQTVKIVVY